MTRAFWSRFRAIACLLAFAFVLFATRAALATDLVTNVDSDEVDVGETFTVELKILPDDDSQAISSPNLVVPPGLSVLQRSVGSGAQGTLVGGRLVQRTMALIQWTVRADKQGNYTIPGPSVRVAGKTYTSSAVKVKVVPAGTGSGGNDPFGGMQRMLRQLQQQQQQLLQQQLGQAGEPLEPDVPLDPKLALEKPTDAIAFLHATVDRTSAVVGEQVTLDVYLYVDAMLPREPDISDPHEPTTSDFLRQSLLDTSSNAESVGYARVGTRIYAVKRVRRYALFPLKTGDLTVDPMRVTVVRQGERMSESFVVRVSEPPVDGRPAGYAIGDVGHFELNADVAPQTVPRDGAVAVTVELKGTGSLPTKLTVPTRPGLEWLTPDVKDKLASTQGVWGGTRTFTYIVRPTKEGTLDLGELTLSYFDPQTRKYGTTRAVLGSVLVTPGAAQKAEDETRILSDLPGARRTMSGAAGSRRFFADRPLFFPLLAAPTALFALVLGGSAALRKKRALDAVKKASPRTELRERERHLDKAVRDTDARAIDAATMRFLEAAAMAKLDVNVRGLGGESLQGALVEAGAKKKDATAFYDLLDECAAARFAPAGEEVESARKRATRARSVAEDLGAPAR